MSLPIIVRSFQLPEETSPVCRASRHVSPVIPIGTPIEVKIDGRWLPAVVTRVVFSTVHVRLTGAADSNPPRVSS